jgi:hypothetical protein
MWAYKNKSKTPKTILGFEKTLPKTRLDIFQDFQ